MCLNGLRCYQNARKWHFESTKFQIFLGSMPPNPPSLVGANHSCQILDPPLKSQLKSLTLLPLWVALFLCGYFPDPTQFEPFFNFWVVNGYNKIPRLETKFSGATNLSQIVLDKMFPRSQFHIRIN